ncbi:hypothetical protein ADUPG1_007415 [Aduncisulcus paluster]|uniref:Alpha-type protein kinase domain-containing protein n=1 Tax=Aduncisulcus paluster TaxID=2918883 RepID=A0ABQ5KM13_9EUKA|nr:hypothetical protein ADUPG1_007415 [Aduncisulcus paluster]
MSDSYEDSFSDSVTPTDSEIHQSFVIQDEHDPFESGESIEMKHKMLEEEEPPNTPISPAILSALRETFVTASRSENLATKIISTVNSNTCNDESLDIPKALPAHSSQTTPLHTSTKPTKKSPIIPSSPFLSGHMGSTIDRIRSKVRETFVTASRSENLATKIISTVNSNTCNDESLDIPKALPAHSSQTTPLHTSTKPTKKSPIIPSSPFLSGHMGSTIDRIRSKVRFKGYGIPRVVDNSIYKIIENAEASFHAKFSAFSRRVHTFDDSYSDQKHVIQEKRLALLRKIMKNGGSPIPSPTPRSSRPQLLVANKREVERGMQRLRLAPRHNAFTLQEQVSVFDKQIKRLDDYRQHAFEKAKIRVPRYSNIISNYLTLKYAAAVKEQMSFGSIRKIHPQTVYIAFVIPACDFGHNKHILLSHTIRSICRQLKTCFHFPCINICMCLYGCGKGGSDSHVIEFTTDIGKICADLKDICVKTEDIQVKERRKRGGESCELGTAESGNMSSKILFRGHIDSFYDNLHSSALDAMYTAVDRVVMSRAYVQHSIMGIEPHPMVEEEKLRRAESPSCSIVFHLVNSLLSLDDREDSIIRPVRALGVAGIDYVCWSFSVTHNEILEVLVNSYTKGKEDEQRRQIEEGHDGQVHYAAASLIDPLVFSESSPQHSVVTPAKSGIDGASEDRLSSTLVPKSLYLRSSLLSYELGRRVIETATRVYGPGKLCIRAGMLPIRSMHTLLNINPQTLTRLKLSVEDIEIKDRKNIVASLPETVKRQVLGVAKEDSERIIEFLRLAKAGFDELPRLSPFPFLIGVSETVCGGSVKPCVNEEEELKKKLAERRKKRAEERTKRIEDERKKKNAKISETVCGGSVKPCVNEEEELKKKLAERRKKRAEERTKRIEDERKKKNAKSNLAMKLDELLTPRSKAQIQEESKESTVSTPVRDDAPISQQGVSSPPTLSLTHIRPLCLLPVVPSLRHLHAQLALSPGRVVDASLPASVSVNPLCDIDTRDHAKEKEMASSLAPYVRQSPLQSNHISTLPMAKDNPALNFGAYEVDWIPTGSKNGWTRVLKCVAETIVLGQGQYGKPPAGGGGTMPFKELIQLLKNVRCGLCSSRDKIPNTRQTMCHLQIQKQACYRGPSVAIFRCRLMEGHSGLPQPGKYVVKVFHSQPHDWQTYAEYVVCASIANTLGTQYNTLLKKRLPKNGSYLRVFFPMPSLIITGAPDFPFLILEQLVEGSLGRTICKDEAEIAAEKSLEAFSHFSYVFSQRKFLVQVTDYGLMESSYSKKRISKKRMANSDVILSSIPFTSTTGPSGFLQSPDPRFDSISVQGGYDFVRLQCCTPVVHFADPCILSDRTRERVRGSDCGRGGCGIAGILTYFTVVDHSCSRLCRALGCSPFSRESVEISLIDGDQYTKLELVENDTELDVTDGA